MRTALFFGIIGFFGGLLTASFLETTLGGVLTAEELQEVMEALPNSPLLLALLTGFQVAILTFLAALIGIRAAKATGLQLEIAEAIARGQPLPPISTIGAKKAISLGLLVSLVLIGADRFFFQFQIPILEANPPSFSLIGLLSGVIYGGVVEEVLMRLFFMSILVWIVGRLIIRRGCDQMPPIAYWVIIGAVALVFGALHFPATRMLFGELTPMLIFRGLLLNGIGGMVFGYLFWQHGLEYAMLCHALPYDGTCGNAVGLHSAFLLDFKAAVTTSKVTG